MRKIYTILLLIISFNLSAQVPNGGFENWSYDPNNNLNPDQWETTNADPMVSVEQYTPAYAGNYSLRAKAFQAGPVTVAGLALISWPFNQRPTHLRVCVKSTVMPGDWVYIMFSAWAGDSVIAFPDSCTFKIDSNMTSFTCINLPLSYMSTLTPDSATIIISGGNYAQAIAGTEIIVDELSFLNVGIEESENLIAEVKAFPNPASEKLLIPLHNNSAKNLTIEFFDAAGKKSDADGIFIVEVDNRHAEVNISSLSQGHYTFRLKTGKEVLTGSFVKN